MKEIFEVKEVKYDIIKSVVLFIILLILIIVFKININISKIATKMHNSFLTISITFAGFLLTALAILVTFPTNEKIEFIKKHKLYPKIFQVYILGVALFGSLFLLSIVGYLLEIQNIYYIGIEIFLFIWAIFNTYRCIWIINKLIKLLH